MIPRAPCRQEHLLPTLEQRQLQHINKQQNARHNRKHQRLIHKLQRRQNHNNRKNDGEQHEHGTRRQSRIRRSRLVAPHGRAFVRLDAFGKDEEHHGAHEDAHDDEEEDVGAAPFVDAEGVEGLAVAVAPHSVFVDALAHVPGGGVGGGVVGVSVLVGIFFELTVDEGHFLLEVRFVVLNRRPRSQRMTRIQMLQLPQSPPIIIIHGVKVVIMLRVIVIHGIVRIHIMVITIIRSSIIVGRSIIRSVIIIVRIIIRRSIIVRIVILLIVTPIIGLGGGGGIVVGIGIVGGGIVGIIFALDFLLCVVFVGLLLARFANVVVVVPGGVSFGEGFGDFFGVAALAAVEGRAEGYLITQKVSINLIPIALHFIIAIRPGALLIPVNNDLELGGGVSVAMLTSDFGIQGIFVVGRFLEHDAVQKANIARQAKVLSIHQRLVIEVRPHVMRDAHDEGSEVLEMTVERGGLFEELKFDHVAVVVIDTTNRHNRHLLKIHIGHIQISIVPHALLPRRHGLVHRIIIVIRPLIHVRVVRGVLI
mmetsp:Transcript_27381/g.49368  ORF Transcript_27381/g.49368 Transcript_27381/m.49368 type:complete len:534 (-) Transcript_27381:399-2000(-)